LNIPFGWMVVLASGLLVDPAAYLVQAVEYGDLSSLGFPLSWKGPTLKLLLDKEPPMMDIGTVECARRGLLTVIGNTGIKQVYENAVEFENSIKEPFDAIVWFVSLFFAFCCVQPLSMWPEERF